MRLLVVVDERGQDPADERGPGGSVLASDGVELLDDTGFDREAGGFLQLGEYGPLGGRLGLVLGHSKSFLVVVSLDAQKYLRKAKAPVGALAF